MKGIQLAFPITLLCFVLSNSVYSQQRSCGTDEYVEQLLKEDKDYAERYHRLMSMKKINHERKSGQACANPVIVPVAVHFNDPVTCDDPVCLLTIVEAQLAVLNAEFSASNADLQDYFDLNTVCPTAYPLETAPVQNEGACMQFCLARTNHPECSGLVDGEPAITVGEHDWSSAPGWEGYLNIFVSGQGGGLGVSVLAGDADGDGFWVTYTAFGAPGVSCTSGATLNTSVIYGLGRTATHEAGHYFGLPHVFGSCNDSDSNPPGPIGIFDTPGQDDSYYGDPTINSCADVIIQCVDNPVSFFSYMDYTDDAGYIMFTADQSDVMNWHANNTSFKTDAVACGGNYGAIVCITTPVATCSDGIQNQDEQDVDCGGTECAPCPSICGKKFYDEAGPCKAYSDQSIQSWTFCPDNTNEILNVSFTLFDVEPQGQNNCWDFLLVYDGANTSAPQIGGEYCGKGVADAPGGGTVAASAPGGCLTFFFDSDQSVIREGWEADIFCVATVPVELIEFTGKHENRKNSLIWSTASEIGNEGFEILKSKDAINFEAISFIKGEGNSSRIVNYTFDDRKISNGQNYFYQLKQVDIDGRTNYSEIISIEVPGKLLQESRIFPNPIENGFLQIELSGFENPNLDYEILNLQGSLLTKGVLNSSVNKINVRDLKGGIYLLRLLDENEYLETKKIVKL